MNKIYVFFSIMCIVALLTHKDTNKVLIHQFLISSITTTGITSLYKYKKVLETKKNLLIKKIFYEKINLLWKKDLSNLVKNKIVPKQWFNIKSLEWNNTAISKNLVFPGSLNKQGSYLLQISTYLLNKDYSALVIQYNLVNLKDNNLIWELSRTFQTKNRTN